LNYSFDIPVCAIIDRIDNEKREHQNHNNAENNQKRFLFGDTPLPQDAVVSLCVLNGG
jgi:hypothetical protein